MRADQVVELLRTEGVALAVYTALRYLSGSGLNDVVSDELASIAEA